MFGMLAGGAMQMWAQERANSANREAAQKQMEFQERMSSTAHTREVNDLRNAGLNPILSAGGGGSSSPGGAMPNIKSIGEGAAASTQGAVRLLADLKILKNTERKTDADATVAEGMAFSAKNKMDYEKKHPKKFGFADAVLQRLGIGARAVGATRTAVTPGFSPGSGMRKKRRPH